MAEEVVTVEREVGNWTVRVHGIYIADYFFESKARRLAMNLMSALRTGPTPENRNG